MRTAFLHYEFHQNKYRSQHCFMRFHSAYLKITFNKTAEIKLSCFNNNLTYSSILLPFLPVRHDVALS